MVKCLPYLARRAHQHRPTAWARRGALKLAQTA